MLQELELENFRCFPSLTLHFSSPHTLFVGANAQGKTSILEAICVLMRLQSPRSGGRKEWTLRGTSHFRISATYDNHHLSIAQNEKERRLRVDQEPIDSNTTYRQSSSLIVWMGNDDFDLIKGPSECRRRYLDFTAAQIIPDHARHLKRYTNALKQRNELLRQNPHPPACHLEAVTAPMLESAIALLHNRQYITARLQPLVTDAVSSLTGGTERLSLTYAPGLIGHFDETHLAQELRKSRDRERRLRQTVIGPHRDDLNLFIDNHSARLFASEGQKRGTAIALKLAQAALLHEVSGRAPILLMDDIFGELDPQRRRALVAHLPSNTQTIITTTHPGWLDDSLPNAQVIRIANANVLG